MHDQPAPTPEEQDAPLERIAEEDAMRAPGFEEDDNLPGGNRPEGAIDES